MIDVSFVTKTSQEANWNGQRQAGGQDNVLSQADALTKNIIDSFEIINI